MSKNEYDQIISYLEKRIESIDSKVFILMVSIIGNVVLSMGILVTLLGN